MTIAFVFPGQGSQSVGMMDALGSAYPQVRAVFEEASEALGRDLWALVTSGPEEELNRTELTQPALLAASVATSVVWNSLTDSRPTIMAGHSLGEYSALVCASSIALADAIRLVNRRGQLMQSAVPAGTGSMAAILGLDPETLDELCVQAAGDEVVSAANINADGQIVIAGHTAAVERASAMAGEAGARKVIPLSVSVPSHCALMKPAADSLVQELEAIDFKRPLVDVIHNADVAASASPEQIRDALVRQLYQPVRWSETLKRFSADGVDCFIECGPGKVLTGLIRRHDRRAGAHALVDQASMEKAVAAVTGEH